MLDLFLRRLRLQCKWLPFAIEPGSDLFRGFLLLLLRRLASGRLLSLNRLLSDRLRLLLLGFIVAEGVGFSGVD